MLISTNIVQQQFLIVSAERILPSAGKLSALYNNKVIRIYYLVYRLTQLYHCVFLLCSSFNIIVLFQC